MNSINRAVKESATALLNGIIQDRIDHKGENVPTLTRALEHNIIYLHQAGEVEEADRLIKLLSGYLHNTHREQAVKRRKNAVTKGEGNHRVSFAVEGTAAYRLRAFFEGYQKGDVVEVDMLAMARALFVSRHTVRIYLKQLKNEGIISYDKIKQGHTQHTITIL